jgi:hypothetical protein
VAWEHCRCVFSAGLALRLAMEIIERFVVWDSSSAADAPVE